MPPKRYFRARVTRAGPLQKKIILLTRLLMRFGIPLRTAARVAGSLLRPVTLSSRLRYKRRRR